MKKIRRQLITSLVTAFVFTMAGSAQSRADLSGDWVLVEALMSGAGRNAPEGTAPDAPRRTSSTTISGAAFNCGTGCTISQMGQTLSVERAQLADYPGKDKSQPTPSVTLYLNGREVKVRDSFSPGRTIAVSARRDGNKVSIASSEPGVGFTQTLSVEGGQLVVVTESARHGAQTIFKYKKK